MSAFLPIEADITLQMAGIPSWGGLLGITERAASGGVSLWKRIRHPWFRSFLVKHRRLAGKLWKRSGHAFEQFLARYFFRGAELGKEFRVTINGIERILEVDVVYKDIPIEVKTGLRIGLDQLRKYAQLIKESDAEFFIYFFLIKPLPSTIQKIEKYGGRVVWLFER